MQTDTMTPAEALLRLAELEKDGVPVLDLRETCPDCLGMPLPCYIQGRHEHVCNRCQGRTWLPKQGWDALHTAMNKVGWRSEIYAHASAPDDGKRLVVFYRPTDSDSYYGPSVGRDSDDWLAAVKAMKAAGF